MEVLRFTIVAVVGVIVDIGISYCLASELGVTLWIAATVGFSSAALANYVAHEFWTFRSDASRISLLRAGQYFITSAVTLLIRLTVIAVVGLWFGQQHSLVILTIAAGTSFAFGFMFSKFLVFSSCNDGTTIA